MTADEFDRILLDKVERQPFQPFTIELLDGTRLDIDRPFSVSFRDGVATCFVRGGRLVPSLRAERVKAVIDATATTVQA